MLINDDQFKRDDPEVIKIVKKLGPKANGTCAELVVMTAAIEYADSWKIHEYDGMESISLDVSKYRLNQIAKVVKARGSLEEIQEILERQVNEDVFHIDTS